jgi:two-component system chemotaxis response regulator CheY
VRPLVLVVDDDADIREAITDLLEVNGYRVAVARNGAEGLERVSEARPDAILLDLAMPVMGGAQFAEELRRRGGSDIPVVVVSAEGNPKRAAQMGAQAYLAKPFDIEDLLMQVASITSKP